MREIATARNRLHARNVAGFVKTYKNPIIKNGNIFSRSFRWALLKINCIRCFNFFGKSLPSHPLNIWIIKFYFQLFRHQIFRVNECLWNIVKIFALKCLKFIKSKFLYFNLLNYTAYIYNFKKLANFKFKLKIFEVNI